MTSSLFVAAVVSMLHMPLSTSVVLAQKKAKPVQIIRGAPVKKTASAPGELPPETKSIPVSEVAPAQVTTVDPKADPAHEEEAQAAKAKKSAAQQRAIEEHGQNVQHEFNNATNALAGQ